MWPEIFQGQQKAQSRRAWLNTFQWNISWGPKSFESFGKLRSQTPAERQESRTPVIVFQTLCFPSCVSSGSSVEEVFLIFCHLFFWLFVFSSTAFCPAKYVLNNIAWRIYYSWNHQQNTTAYIEEEYLQEWRCRGRNTRNNQKSQLVHL